MVHSGGEDYWRWEGSRLSVAVLCVSEKIIVVIDTYIIDATVCVSPSQRRLDSVCVKIEL